MHFCFSILGVCHFCHVVVKKVFKILTLICISTWQGTKRHYNKNIQFITHALASQRSLEMAPHLTPPPLARLHCTWTLVHVKEYVYVVHALAPNTLATPLVETITTLHHFHPLAKVKLPPFIEDFHPKTNFFWIEKLSFMF